MKFAFSRKNIWERIPGPVRRGLAPVLGAVPLSLVLGPRFRRTLAFLHRAQWWSEDRCADWQLQELKRIFGIAYERTAFYRRIFDDAGLHPSALRHPDDVRKLPTIDKVTIRAHLREMCAVSPKSPHVDYVSTNGTSGQPLSFYIGSGRSSVEYAYLLAGWERAGYRVGDRLGVLKGRSVPVGPDGFAHESDPLLRFEYYSSFHMTDEHMELYVRHIASIGRCFIHANPSTISALARFLRRSGIEPPENVQGILLESEILYDEQRSLVQEVFGRRVFSSYGHTEKLIAAAECEQSTLYHVWPTYGYVELIDDRGEPVTTPGTEGELVGTGFINDVMPFIRYRTGDRAIYRGAKCPACGRGHSLIEKIRGHKLQEQLVLSDGTSFSWNLLIPHDDSFDRVLRMQFVQERPGHATLHVIPAEGFGSADQARIAAAVDRKVGDRLRIDITPVDSIPTTRGKAIYVVQRITSPAAPPPAASPGAAD